MSYSSFYNVFEEVSGFQKRVELFDTIQNLNFLTFLAPSKVNLSFLAKLFLTLTTCYINSKVNHHAERELTIGSK